MNRIIFIISLLLVSLQSVGKETLDVLVVYDAATINNESHLNTSSERYNQSITFINQLRSSFSNSALSSTYDFNLIGSKLQDFTSLTNMGTPTIKKLSDRYKSYLILSVNNEKQPFGVLQKMQKQYKADIVLGVFPSELGPLNTGMCGAAAHIPFKDTFNGYSLTKNLEIAGFGISFINAKQHCLDKRYLVAHEVGHGFGLFHGKAIEPSIFETYKNDMLDYASGKGYNMTDRLEYRGTIMAQPGFSDSDDNHNFFSNTNKDSCGFLKSSPCGDAYSSAVVPLIRYSSHYNKRGDWYK